MSPGMLPLIYFLCVFMDNLINIKWDVAYLHERGIIEHWLGSNAEVANMFNGLCKELVFYHNISYLATCREMFGFYFLILCYKSCHFDISL